MEFDFNVVDTAALSDMTVFLVCLNEVLKSFFFVVLAIILLRFMITYKKKNASPGKNKHS